MVFSTLTKLILAPIYYLIHHNYLFGLLHKTFIKKFNYKNLSFELNIKGIPIQNHSSYLFNTYEYNDRKLIEKHVSKKNKSIVLGGGIGFIPVLAYKKSNNQILIFEVNKNIIPNLRKNLVNNNVIFKIYNNNLVFKKTKNKLFYLTEDFLSTSSKVVTKSKILIKNLEKNKIKNFSNFNTLIVDIEGDEDYYTLNINKFENIKYLFFELHHNIIKKEKVNKIMNTLFKNNFKLEDKCFNSYYFKR